MHTTVKRGFTLIELLVVIAIIGILSSVVLASLNTARLKSRDARRESDLKQLQNAEELYSSSQANGSYSATIVALTTTYIPSEPKDPSTLASYGYAVVAVNGVNTHYCIGATLEGTAPVSACPTGVTAPAGNYFVGQ